MEEILNIGIHESDDDNDDFDDLVVEHLLNEGAMLGLRAALYGRFSLENVLEEECFSLFRFFKADIVRLCRDLAIPETVRTTDRVTVSGIDGLCILLRRLTYPNRLVDLEKLFGFSSTVLSNIINLMLDIISNNKLYLLENLRNNIHINYEKLVEYAQSISRNGSPVGNCWGFIDGTVRPICRPSINQEHYYSGHKRLHCLKYQSVICPDGIIISLKGPYEGRRHDAGIFRESGLYNELEANMVFPGQNPSNFVLYGDQAYGLRELLLRPYSQHEIANNPDQQQFNNFMSLQRISVEWGFGKIIQNFAFLDFKKNQKILLQDVGRMFKVGVLLTNCHTCFYGCQTASYFNMIPPVLEVYLNA